MEQKIDIGMVWHLFSEHYQMAVLTLCDLNIADRQKYVGQPWKSLPDDLKRRIFELLVNIGSAA